MASDKNFGGLGFVIEGSDKGSLDMFEDLNKAITDVREGLLEFNDYGKSIDLDALSEGIAESVEGLAKFKEAIPNEALKEFAAEVSNDAARIATSLDTNSDQLLNSFTSIGDQVEVLARKNYPELMGAFDDISKKASQFKQKASDVLAPWMKGASEVGKALGGAFKGIGTAGKAMGSIVMSAGSAMMGAFSKGKDAVKKVYHGFKDLTGVVSTLNKLVGLSRLQTLVQGAILDKLNSVAQKVAHVGELGMNLTTGWEAHMQALGVSSRKAAANLGVTGKELDKMTGQAAGMAHGMNISTDAAADAIYSFSKAQKEFAAAGIDSAQTLAKFTDLTGISATQMRETLLKARKELKFDDAQIKLVTNSFLAMGRAIGNVPAAMQDMPQVLDMMSQLKAEGVHDTKVLASFAAQSAALARGFKETGLGAEAARSTALTLTKTIIDAKSRINAMFAGTEADITEFTKELGISTGDITKAFDLMKQGPEGMTAGLAQMVLGLKKQGKDVTQPLVFLKKRLEGAIGPEAAANLTNFLSNASEETLAMMESTKQASSSLGDFAKEGWRSSKTLQDAWDDAKNNFVTNFRNIGRQAAVDFVRDTSAEFNKFNEQLNGMVKKGGPMSAVVTKLSEMHQIGVTALIPKTLRPMAALFGGIAQQLIPMVAQLGAIGLKFSMLTNPVSLLVLVVGGLTAWFLKLRKEGKSTGEAFDHIKDTISKFADIALEYAGKALEYLVDITTKIAYWAQKFDWASMFKKLFSGTGSAAKKGFAGVAVVFEDIFNVIVDTITGKTPHAKTKIGKLFRNIAVILQSIVKGFIKAAEEVDWKGLATKVALKLEGGLKSAVDLITTKGPVLFDKLLGLAKGLIEVLFTGKPSLLSKVMDELPTIVATVGNFLLTILDKAIGFLVDVVPKLTKKLLGVLDSILDGLTDKGGEDHDGWLALVIANAIGHLKDNIADLGKALLKVLDQVFEFVEKQDLTKIFMSLLNILTNAFTSAVDALLPVLSKFFSEKLPKLWGIVREKLVDVLKTLPGELGAWLQRMGNKMKEWGPQIGKTILKLFIETITALPKLLWKILVNLPEILLGIGKLLWGVWNFVWKTIIGIVEGVWEGIKEAFGKAVDWFGDLLKDIYKWFAKFFSSDAKPGDASIAGAVKGAWASIKPYWDGAIKFFKDLLGNILDDFRMIWEGKDGKGGIKGLVTGVWEAVKELWKGAVAFFVGVLKDVKEVVNKGWDEVLGIFGKKPDKELTSAGKAIIDRQNKISEDLGKTMQAPFKETEKTVKEIHGNSLNTYVAHDMNKVAEIFEESGDSMTGSMLKFFDDTYKKGLPKTLKSGLDIARPEIADFNSKTKTNFQNTFNDIANSFTEMMLKILTQLQITSGAIASEISISLGNLKAVEVQLHTMREANNKAKAEEAKLKAAQNKSEAPGSSINDAQAKLLEAINVPEWYRDYKNNSEVSLQEISSATKQMAQVMLTVGPAGVGGTPGSAAAAARSKLGAAPIPSPMPGK